MEKLFVVVLEESSSDGSDNDSNDETDNDSNDET